MKIAADRDTCIGAGMCVLTAPAFFDQDDDGIVQLLVEDVSPGDADVARQAVALCPSGALRVLDD
ncbi:ferredoxin [Pseudonocardia sp.]|jgi:ferredoxin|uniref:ferredoxin n=1 Tax=Pseudonocardia sp. TaxID=60912 RepID=UPI002D83391C|nr:ferredoxin [Pseudonocardia sp.]